MQQWEYVEYFNSNLPKMRELNEYGEDGWELVAIIPDESATAGKGFRLYFKRPISN